MLPLALLFLALTCPATTLKVASAQARAVPTSAVPPRQAHTPKNSLRSRPPAAQAPRAREQQPPLPSPPKAHTEDAPAPSQPTVAPASRTQPQKGQAPQPTAALRGQEHHAISHPISKALENHPKLQGLYQPRDSRFVTRAADKDSHNGYQQWHRNVDREMIEWLRNRPDATSREFEEKLREIYSRPEMRKRFPNGL